MKKINNFVAVVTGAGSGIGRALAVELAKWGCHLALSDINEVDLSETQKLCKGDRVKVCVYKLDVSDRAAVFLHVEKVVLDFDHVNIVINNDGLISMPKQFAYNAANLLCVVTPKHYARNLLIDKLPVQVSCVHPGFIATNITKNTRMEKKGDAEALIFSFNKIARTSPEKAAQDIVRGIQCNKSRILVGPDAYVFEGLHRIFGIQYQKITQLIARKCK